MFGAGFIIIIRIFYLNQFKISLRFALRFKKVDLHYFYASGEKENESNFFVESLDIY